MNIKFAIIGFGHIGRKHLNTIADNNRAEVVAICDPFIAENSLEGIPVFKTIDELMASGLHFDVANICTPNGLHAPQAIECIIHSKHVVIEKPMSLYKKDAENIIFHALNKNVKIFCVMQNRYTANAQFLKQLIAKNDLGDIQEVMVSLFWNRDERYYFEGSGVQHAWRGSQTMDGGPLFTQFSHFVDLLYWLFGDLDVTSSRMSNLAHSYVPDIEDNGQFTFTNSGGIIGSFRYSINAAMRNIESSVLISGSKGSIKVSGQYLENIDLFNTSEVIENPFQSLDNTKTHQSVIDNVIDVIRTGSNISTNAMEGMKVVEIIENVYRMGKNR
jgi:UDP-N-acetyl-2-amino-2-deoxyglucuronate dehydrogenase